LSLEQQRSIYGGIIYNHWLLNIGVTLMLGWHQGNTPRLHLVNGGFYGPGGWPRENKDDFDSLSLGWPEYSLFGTLALQLVSAICTDERLVRCGRCGQVFFFNGERVPRRDQPHYCSEACSKEARREDKREWAARKRAAKRAADSQEG
jgi:hypothetical protein